MTIRTWLKQNNLRAQDLADKAGISSAQLSRILNGLSRPSWQTAVKISKATGNAYSPLSVMTIGDEPEDDGEPCGS